MNTEEIEAARSRLQTLRAELMKLREGARDAGRPVELDQTSVGRLSRMDAMQAQQMAREADRRREQQLAAIDGALRRLDRGEYGYCFVCQEEIDARRLAVDPAVTRCLRCSPSSQPGC